jgi:hypothetical protein
LKWNTAAITGSVKEGRGLMASTNAAAKYRAEWRRQVRRFETLWKTERAKRLRDIRHLDAFLKRMKRLKPNDIRGFRVAVSTLRNRIN